MVPKVDLRNGCIIVRYARTLQWKSDVCVGEFTRGEWWGARACHDVPTSDLLISSSHESKTLQDKSRIVRIERTFREKVVLTG